MDENKTLSMPVQDGVEPATKEDTEGAQFLITDMSMADYQVEQLLIAEKEYAQEIKRLDEIHRNRVDFLTRGHEFNRTRILKALEGYFDSVPDEMKQKTQTLTKLALMSGELVRKTQEPEYIVDKDALGDEMAAAGMNDYFEVRHVGKWGAMKKMCWTDGPDVFVHQTDKITGEMVPLKLQSVRAEARPPKFEVKP